MLLLCLCTALYLSTCLTKANGTCMDIDTQACQILHAKRPDMCNDIRISEGVCPKFCGICPVMCYHCDIPLMDYHDCYTTKTCAQGEACLLKELKSTEDGHEEYYMTCAPKQACDGAGLSFLFGKRNTEARDVHARCCFTDLCNIPPRIPSITSGSTKTTAQSTTTTIQPTITTFSVHPGCRRDIVFMIDTSMRYHGSGTGIRPFLASSYAASIRFSIQLIYNVVASLTIGPRDNLVALGSFDASVHAHWDLRSYYDKHQLLQAISNLRNNITFKGHGDVENAVQSVVNSALSTQHGDRPSYANDVVLITDKSSVFHNDILKHSLQQKSRDVIVVSLGNYTSPNSNVDDLATAHDHVVHVPSYTALTSANTKLLKLLCY